MAAFECSELELATPLQTVAAIGAMPARSRMPAVRNEFGPQTRRAAHLPKKEDQVHAPPKTAVELSCDRDGVNGADCQVSPHGATVSKLPIRQHQQDP
jgi:hypothetical protein